MVVPDVTAGGGRGRAGRWARPAQGTRAAGGAARAPPVTRRRSLGGARRIARRPLHALGGAPGAVAGPGARRRAGSAGGDAGRCAGSGAAPGQVPGGPGGPGRVLGARVPGPSGPLGLPRRGAPGPRACACCRCARTAADLPRRGLGRRWGRGERGGRWTRWAWARFLGCCGTAGGVGSGARRFRSSPGRSQPWRRLRTRRCARPQAPPPVGLPLGRRRPAPADGHSKLAVGGLAGRNRGSQQRQQPQQTLDGATQQALTPCRATGQAARPCPAPAAAAAAAPPRSRASRRG